MLKLVLLLGLLVAWYLHRRGLRGTAGAMLVAGAIMATGAAFFVPKTASCAWCPSYTCYSRCSSSCSCIAGGGSIGGKCYSIQYSDQLLMRDGYRELE